MIKKVIVSFLIIVAIFVVCLFVFYKKKGNFIEKLINQNNSIIIYNNADLQSLSERTVLFNFYNTTDLTNVFSLDLAEKIQKLYKDKLVVVDVINNKDGYTQDNIKKFIIKNNIKRLVFVVDNDEYGNNNYLTLVDNRGIVKGVYNNKNESELLNDIDLLKLKTWKKINFDFLKEKNVEPFTKSLNYISYWNNHLVLVDSSDKSINIITKNGQIVKRFSDFCRPSGIAIKNDEIYVADICDNSIKKIDLKTNEIYKIIETEKPLALAFINDDLIISTSENLLLYKNNELDIMCENCENIFKLSIYDKKIYFIHNGYIKFMGMDGFINNIVDINNNILLNVDETGIYLADKINDRILKFNGNDYEIYSSKIYSSPTDIIDYKDKLYITNENEGNIILLDRITKNFEKISIDFAQNYSDKNFDNKNEFLDINDSKTIKINNRTSIILNLKNNYFFSNYAPQKIELFEEDKKNNTAILIKKYKIDDLNEVIKLQELKNNKIYYLKINLFYKKDDEKLLIKSDILKLIVSEKNKNNKLEINFPNE